MTIQRDERITGLVLPGDEGWDLARRAWNLTVDQHPAAVAQPATVAELQEAVRWARRAGLRIAAQSTGHGAETLGPLDGVLVLKTSRLDAIAAGETSVRAEAGVLAAAAASAAGAQGRAPTLGFAPTVGVAGLTLNGGVGWLSRAHGLAANNARAFEVVLADGELARVDATHEPDLFWALRGGGGRGAIVVALELETHAVPGLFGGTIAWPASCAADVLERFRRCAPHAPEALTLVFRHIGPANLVTITAVYVGNEADATAALAPLRTSRGVVHDTFAPLAPADLVRIAGDPEEPSPGRGGGVLLDDLAIDASERIAAMVEGDELAPLAVLELRQLGGALTRAPDGHGALARLDARFLLFAAGQATDAGTLAAIDARFDDLQAQLRPWTARQAALSAAPVGTDPATGFDAGVWQRLGAVRDAYDPDGVLIATHDLYAGTAP